MTVIVFPKVDIARVLVGKPFAWRGRGPHEYDCWGLVRECLLLSGAKHVPDYPSSEVGAANCAMMLDAMQGGWRRLHAPEAGAAVVFKMSVGGHWHCGYMLTKDAFIHTTEETHGAVVERVSSPLWARLVVGYYVWEPKSPRIQCAVSL